jgi:hypothetical protein
MGKVQACYTKKFKLEAVWYAQQHGNRAAVRKFDVDEINISDGHVKEKNWKEFLKINLHFVVKSASNHTWKPSYISML